MVGHRGATEFVAMNADRAVMLFAGALTLLGTMLGWRVSPYWNLLSAFVGANLMQASITGFCPAARIFRALGVRPGTAFP